MNKNLVVLAYAHASPFPYHSWTPLSILAPGAYLEKHGIEVEYFDERIHTKKRFKQLIKRNPLLVGLSTMTCYQIKNTSRLASHIRDISPEVPIVWGGVHPTMCAEQTLESKLVDFVVRGEGEQTLLELVKALNDGRKDFGGIDGLGWRKDGAIILNKDRSFMDINELPFPYDGKGREILATYLAKKNTLENVGYESSRGCPFKCGFCYNEFFHRNVCRVKSLEKVKAELQKLRDLGVEKMTFYDDTLLAGRRELISTICDLLKQSRLQWVANVRINLFTPEMLRKFEDSGCIYLFFGIESSDEDILKYLKKGQNKKQIYDGIKLISKGNIKTVYSLIVGLPNETEGDLKRNLDFADEIRKMHPDAEIALQPYIPLPGTFLYIDAIKSGFTPPKRLIDWKNFTNDEIRNPWVRDKKLLNAIYVTSFLAFRYERFLKGFWGDILYRPFHKLALLRWRKRYFNYFFEGYIYVLYKRLGRIFIFLGKHLNI